MASPPSRRLALVSLVVPDYDEALAFYVDGLGFRLTEDTHLAEGRRWVTVSPGKDGADLLLARAADDRQHAVIGAQAGGRVWLFLHTDDFARDRAAFQAAGCRLRGGAAVRALRHGRGVSRPVRQSLGSYRTVIMSVCSHEGATS